jgi:hypothetical protein
MLVILVIIKGRSVITVLYKVPVLKDLLLWLILHSLIISHVITEGRRFYTLSILPYNRLDRSYNVDAHGCRYTLIIMPVQLRIIGV